TTHSGTMGFTITSYEEWADSIVGTFAGPANAAKDRILTRMIGTTALAIVVLTAQANQSIDSYVQKNFDDASLTARVKFANQKELAKINDDFGKSYRVPYTD